MKQLLKNTMLVIALAAWGYLIAHQVSALGATGLFIGWTFLLVSVAIVMCVKEK